MELNVEVERTTRHRIVVRISVPEVFTAEQARKRAVICAADITGTAAWECLSTTYETVR